MLCENCFDSDVIHDYIVKVGIKNDNFTECSFCNSDSQYRIEKSEFKYKVQRIIMEHYQHDYEHGIITSATMMAREEGDDISVFLPGTNTSSLKDICYDLFNLDTINEKFYDLLDDSSSDDESYFSDFPDSEVWMDIGCSWSGDDFIELEWDEFCNNVKHKARFFDHEGYNRGEVLSKLDKTFETLKKNISIELYRARGIRNDSALSRINNNPNKELGIAPIKLAKHNRFSPIGIPYVYLSEDNETILKEIRAKIGDKVGIGKFKIDDLDLVDLRNNNLTTIRNDIFNESCTSELLCSFNVLKDFIQNITQEISEEDNHLEYIPTQLVSEYIWSLGYDGFIFDSSLCDGSNYVLFTDSYTFVTHYIKTIEDN